MIYLRIFELCVIAILVIDFSGAVDSVKWAVAKWMGSAPEHIRIKPFDCSKCMTFWLGIGYATLVGALSFEVVLFTLALSVMSIYISSAIAAIVLWIEKTVG